MRTERVLDNRGLEPPEPLVRVLDTLTELGADEVLVVRNDRRPMFLFPRLDELGYVYTCEDQPDGSVVVRIARAGRASARASGQEEESSS